MMFLFGSKMVSKFISYPLLATGTLGLVISGLYVTSQDRNRTDRMIDAFSRGRILAPFAPGVNEVAYFRRPQIEARIRQILRPTFSNEYYIIIGQVGSGKSRTIRHIIKQMMETSGTKKEGAPIYISANQGNDLATTLAKGVNFYFDEHLNFHSFCNVALGIQRFPKRDHHKSLVRVLAMIEEAAYLYVMKNRKPVVLVIDGLEFDRHFNPDELRLLHEKAALWADTNIVKTVFVCTGEETENVLQKDTHLWGRAAMPYHIRSLQYEESFQFVKDASRLDGSILADVACKGLQPMTDEYIFKVVAMAEGRPNYLLYFIYDWAKGIPFGYSCADLVLKERTKIMLLDHIPEAIAILKRINGSVGKKIKMTELAKLASIETMRSLQQLGIISMSKTSEGVIVKFNSKLIEQSIAELD